ncbi:MAG: hypothetical protein ACTSP9_03035, partial [Promethearchaeota archaeon]
MNKEMFRHRRMKKPKMGRKCTFGTPEYGIPELVPIYDKLMELMEKCPNALYYANMKTDIQEAQTYLDTGEPCGSMVEAQRIQDIIEKYNLTPT